jgi:nucleoid DNA-binding protein
MFMVTRSKTPKATSAGHKPRAAGISTAAAAMTDTAHAAATPLDGAPDAAADDAAPTQDSNPGFKRNDLIDAVAGRSELKRSDVRVLMELVLDEIGNALDRHDEVALTPLGKFSVKKRKDANNGNIIVTRIKRQKRDETGAQTALAEPDEDS